MLTLPTAWLIRMLNDGGRSRLRPQPSHRVGSRIDRQPGRRAVYRHKRVLVKPLTN
jgi:hypothetical protein